MKRFLPDTLAGRTIVILVIGLGLFHVWSIWIYQIGTENLLGSAREQGLAESLIAATRALAELPADQREPTAHALSSTDLEIHWSRVTPVNSQSLDPERWDSLRRALQKVAPDLSDRQVRFAYADDTETPRHLLLASLQLRDGSWVTFGMNAFWHRPVVEHDVVGSLTAMAAGIVIVSVFLVRSINAPLRTLASAADRIGADISATGAPETGPREIRLVARAYNTMQKRIRRLIADRTQTLAAVSHDLKTPLTRLRLRAEFVKDDELRELMSADLDEMERMLDSTLAFLRGDPNQEESKMVDLVSVLETLCDQAADAGGDVTLGVSGRAPLRCRPLALKRALSNLIDNAVKYGHRARVTLHDKPRELAVVIEDDGPGIPESEAERVFDPFYRIEGSRSRETGGTGLGLTIARMVIRAHGGDIAMENRKSGGLHVIVLLPKT